MTPIVLYIFSGPHLGARISLKQQKTVIGSDDSADIILYAQKESKDFAIEKRHVAIEIPDDIASSGLIQIEELDGKIFIENLANEENPLESQEIISVAAGQVFYLASTCMVWNFPHVEQEMVSPALYGKKILASEILTNEDDNFVANSDEENEEDSTLIMNNDEQEQEEKELSFANSLLLKAKYPLLYTALIILFLSLSLYYSPKSDNFISEYEFLSQELKKMNYNDLLVEENNINNQRGILISGYVASEEERHEILNLARSLHYPVYLDLEVQGDLVRAVEDSFALYGLSLEPRIEANELVISGYVFNKAIEDAAFYDLVQNVQNLPIIERNIIHSEELSSQIQNNLNEAQIKYADIAYDPGQVRIIGHFDDATMDNIHTIMNKIMQQNQIPISYTLHSSEPNITASQLSETTNTNTSQNVEENLFSQSNPQNNETMTNALNFLGDISINSVHHGAIPFITTAEDKKYFEGTALQNGFVIETIGKDSIELRKGSQIKRIYFSSNDTNQSL